MEKMENFVHNGYSEHQLCSVCWHGARGSGDERSPKAPLEKSRKLHVTRRTISNMTFQGLKAFSRSLTSAILMLRRAGLNNSANSYQSNGKSALINFLCKLIPLIGGQSTIFCLTEIGFHQEAATITLSRIVTRPNVIKLRQTGDQEEHTM